MKLNAKDGANIGLVVLFILALVAVASTTVELAEEVVEATEAPEITEIKQIILQEEEYEDEDFTNISIEDKFTFVEIFPDGEDQDGIMYVIDSETNEIVDIISITMVETEELEEFGEGYITPQEAVEAALEFSSIAEEELDGIEVRRDQDDSNYEKYIVMWLYEEQMWNFYVDASTGVVKDCKLAIEE